MTQTHTSPCKAERLLRHDEAEECHSAYYILLRYERGILERCAGDRIQYIDRHGVNVKRRKLKREVQTVGKTLPIPIIPPEHTSMPHFRAYPIVRILSSGVWVVHKVGNTFDDVSILQW